MNGLTAPILFVIAGIIFIFYSVTGSVILPKTKGLELKNWQRAILGILGCAFLIVGILFTYSISLEDKPKVTSQFEPYMVYSDMGIAAGNVWHWGGDHFGLEPIRWIDGNYASPDVPEGATCFVIMSGRGEGNYAGWGVYLGLFIGDSLIKPATVDLSDYESLEFWVKSPVDLKVELQQNNSDGKKSSKCLISYFGWDSNSPDEWQKVVIPKGAFGNMDWTKIFSPFIITGDGSEITYYIDKVMWSTDKSN